MTAAAPRLVGSLLPILTARTRHGQVFDLTLPLAEVAEGYRV